MKLYYIAFIYFALDNYTLSLPTQLSIKPHKFSPTENVEILRKGSMSPTIDKNTFFEQINDLPPKDQKKAIDQQVDEWIDSGSYNDLGGILKEVEMDLVLNRVILKGDLRALESTLVDVEGANLKKFIQKSAEMNRLDMIVVLAKHGDLESLEIAFREVIMRSNKHHAFLGFLFRETKDIHGSLSVANDVYRSIMSSDYPQKLSVANSFIENSDPKYVLNWIEPLDSINKNKLLLKRASKLDKNTVMAYAKEFSPNEVDLEFEKALQPFAKNSDWYFILDLTRYRAIAVANVILWNLPAGSTRQRLFRILLGQIEENASEYYWRYFIFRKVAQSGDVALIKQFFENGKVPGNSKMNNYMHFPKMKNANHRLIAEGIVDASETKQYDMIRYLLTKIDPTANNNLLLNYAAYHLNRDLVSILLENDQVIKAGLDKALGYTREKDVTMYIQLKNAQRVGAGSQTQA